MSREVEITEREMVVQIYCAMLLKEDPASIPIDAVERTKHYRKMIQKAYFHANQIMAAKLQNWAYGDPKENNEPVNPDVPKP